jgi:HSP20 family protein
MSKDLIRLMNALFFPGAEAWQGVPWRPLVDVYRTPDGWLVKFDLAGVRAEDVDLQVLGGRMHLCGVRRDCVLEEARKSGRPLPVPHRMEIAYSRFERTLDLPCDLKRAEITTTFTDGLLLVLVKPETEKEAPLDAS